MVKNTILITGGLGCLGGELSKYLVDLGYQVFIGSSRSHAKLPDELENCSLVYTDFDKLDTLVDACSKVDCVIHLATLNAQQSQADPQLAVKVNGIGTLNLIQASIANNIKYFLYFSTAHIYGTPLIGEIDENTLPKPLHPYAITHRLAEDFLLKSINSKDINGCVIRLSNSVGLPLIKEANCWMLFINDACKQAVVSRRIIIRSNINSERDFIPITTVCKITEYFVSEYITDDYPVFNVGSGISYNLLQIAKMIVNRCEELFRFSPEIIFSGNSVSQNCYLDYKVDKLIKKRNFVINNDLELESSIDEILKFCNTESMNERYT